jgi:hypothetical protein
LVDHRHAQSLLIQDKRARRNGKQLGIARKIQQNRSVGP